jgi:DNA-binding response OmpR family regulator
MSRILIVDDDAILRATVADILVEEGYEVAEAGDGADALVMLNTADFDVVMSDVKMPKMDGLIFLHQIKANHSEIPVIMLTGHGTIDTAVEAMRRGAVNYLLKPSNRRQILESVREAIELKRVNRQKQNLLNQVVTGLQQLGVVETHPLTEQIRQTIVAPEGRLQDQRFLKIRDLMIDQHRLVALYKGKPLELTPTEFEILYCLVQAEGRVVTFEEVVFRLQGIRTERDEARSMISTHISNLRAKLREAGCDNYLVNSRAHGYFINVDG